MKKKIRIVDTSKRTKIIDTSKTLPRLSPEDVAKALGGEIVGRVPKGWSPWFGIPPAFRTPKAPAMTEVVDGSDPGVVDDSKISKEAAEAICNIKKEN